MYHLTDLWDRYLGTEDRHLLGTYCMPGTVLQGCSSQESSDPRQVRQAEETKARTGMLTVCGVQSD